MNVERPRWSILKAGKPVTGALRSIFEPHHRLPGELLRLLDDLEHGANRRVKGASNAT